MRVLIIFDSLFDPAAAAQLIGRGSRHEILLFPLTSDGRAISSIVDGLESRGFQTRILNSGPLVDHEIRSFRKGLRDWSAAIGAKKVQSKTIIEWLMIPGMGLSSWWLSILSEKNPLKTDVFLKMAQAMAARRLINSEKPDLLLSGTAVKSALSRSLKLVSASSQVPFKAIPITAKNAHNQVNLRERITGWGALAHLILALHTWMYYVGRGHSARCIMPPLKKRLAFRNPLLFISYFPSIDEEAARNGEFRNRYTPGLQEMLEKGGVPVTWLLMTVEINGYGFRESVRLARNLSGGDQVLFFLEEFLTPSIAFRALYLWVRQMVVSLRLFRFVKGSIASESPERAPFMSSLWRASFIGSVSMEGILFSLMYGEVFKRIKGISQCLYLCEMHAWEKALNAARNRLSPSTRTIGYQHTSVARNYFHYFYSDSEIGRAGNATDLPLPDVIACNGKLMNDLLSEAGYKNTHQVEAIRFLYLEKKLTSVPAKAEGRRPILLLVGSSDRTETASLVRLLNESFPVSDAYEIWLKGHPSLPMEGVLDELGIDASTTGYKIQTKAISECMEEVRAIIVGSSAVSVEALAFGCEVIIPVFPETMLLSPLADFEEYCHFVCSAEELKETTEKIVGGHTLGSPSDYQDFISRYWNIDPCLPKWSDLLKGIERR